MARRAGYNTNWLWKQWQRECRAVRQARQRGQDVDADAAADRATDIEQQMLQHLNDELTDARFGPLEP